VLERLKADCNLNLSAHRAAGGSQIQGASGSAVQEILTRFDEHRPFLREGGRTNRGAPGDIRRMLETLRKVGLADLDAGSRIEILGALQKYLVERVREWHARKRLSFSFDPAKSAWHVVHEILERAREAGKEGPIAQYLVGAKLQLRYPDIQVENFSYSTADAQQGRPGDFLVADTAFHVTVSPMTGVYDKCRTNLRDGLRVYLIVPDRNLQGTRQNAEAIEPGRIFVDSLEAFVGGNLDEMSMFNRQSAIDQLRQLIEVYSARVDAVEMDKSMLIEVPPALSR
jgi:hypothetical protein